MRHRKRGGCRGKQWRQQTRLLPTLPLGRFSPDNFQMPITGRLGMAAPTAIEFAPPSCDIAEQARNLIRLPPRVLSPFAARQPFTLCGSVLRGALCGFTFFGGSTNLSGKFVSRIRGRLGRGLRRSRALLRLRRNSSRLSCAVCCRLRRLSSRLSRGKRLIGTR